MVLIEGRKIANEIYENLAIEVKKLQEEKNLQPLLTVILVGDNPASLSYIKQKRKACEKTGIKWEQFDYEESITTEEIINKVHELNERKDVHGILVQLPLPEHVYAPDVIKAIDPQLMIVFSSVESLINDKINVKLFDYFNNSTII